MFGFGKKTKKILIVEDDVHNHVLFRKAFTEAGFEVLICQNAEDDFIAEVTNFKPDIISMDVMLAKAGRVVNRDGFEAIALLKANEETKRIPIIVLTNFSDETKVEKAKALGAVDFINLQGQSLPTIARECMTYVKNPRRYKPNHAQFRA